MARTLFAWQTRYVESAQIAPRLYPDRVQIMLCFCLPVRAFHNHGRKRFFSRHLASRFAREEAPLATARRQRARSRSAAPLGSAASDPTSADTRPRGRRARARKAQAANRARASSTARARSEHDAFAQAALVQSVELVFSSVAHGCPRVSETLLQLARASVHKRMAEG
eukprot:6196769-Pleurochrysis_carterae.AAC.1